MLRRLPRARPDDRGRAARGDRRPWPGGPRVAPGRARRGRSRRSLCPDRLWSRPRSTKATAWPWPRRWRAASRSSPPPAVRWRRRCRPRRACWCRPATMRRWAGLSRFMPSPGFRSASRPAPGPQAPALPRWADTAARVERRCGAGCVSEGFAPDWLALREALRQRGRAIARCCASSPVGGRPRAAPRRRPRGRDRLQPPRVAPAAGRGAAVDADRARPGADRPRAGRSWPNAMWPGPIVASTSRRSSSSCEHAPSI